MNFKEKLKNISINNPKVKAITENGVNITYGELLDNSQSIIYSVEKYELVGLYFEKSIEYLQALFAITLSNKAFLPLELISPEERLSYIANDANLKVIITSNKYPEYIISKLPSNLKVIYIEDVLQSIPLETTFNIEENELAYVIYTSGSTGNPKGVNVSFNGLNNVIEQQIDIFKMDKSNFYLYLAISFDASLSDIYCSFLSASNLFIKDELKKDIINLKEYFNDNKITHSDLPPSLLKMVNPEDFKFLESIVIGGEVADYASVQAFSKVINVVNVYGPTEATICTSYCYCDENWDKPLIGKPLNNVHYIIVDENMKTIQEPEIVGELLISGCQLATGYLNNDELTNEKFINIDGLTSINTGEIINNIKHYRTGDLVRYNEIYDIEFIGRIDRQIKYHGQLICLEEVESAINSIPEVKSVSVVFKNKKLYAYFEGNIQDLDIKSYLKNKIPHCMIPSFIINKQLPKTVTGKNDGKLLSLDSNQSDEINILINLFRKILELDENIVITPEMSFIKDLNSDSMNFIQLHIELEQIGINIEYDYLIENNSINGILNYGEKIKKITTDYLVDEYSEIELPKNIRNISKITPKKVLITGATGFLGTKLLGELLPHVDEIHCIVRGTDHVSAFKRLCESLKKNKIKVNIRDFNKKVCVHIGDVSKEHLGLNELPYRSLINNIDNVYHCAAEVNNIKSYKQLYNSNVLSTINVSKFIFDGCDKNLHYASTLSVYVSSDMLDNSVLEEEYLTNDSHRLYSGYAQTKWLTEYYLNQINKISNNVFSYRFGLLTADTQTGVSPANSFLDTCMKQLKEIGETPYDEINISMDITPIDIATKAMVNISIKENSNIYHITTNYQLTLRKISELLGDLIVIPTETWFEKHGSNMVAQYMTLLNSIYVKQRNMNLFETTDVKSFSTKNSYKYIEKFDMEKYLKNI
jgi:amino acid adenylation domain-containing protein/thioester reductase-like protein